MEKKRMRVVIFIVLAAIAAYGTVQEAGPDHRNGAFAHLIVGPVTPLLAAMIVMWRKGGFWRQFGLGWLTSSAGYLVLLVLMSLHYEWERQPEWIWFWAVQSVALYAVHALTHTRPKKK